MMATETGTGMATGARAENGALTLDAIPHRPPFLFVDKIVEVSADRIVTTTHADPEAEFFRGHYPHQPVMPGVLLCECCFQAGALLLAHRLGGFDPAKGVPVITRIRDARFKRIVRPGDVLNVEVVMDEVLDRAFYMTGRMTVGGASVLRVGFVCMQAEPDEPEPDEPIPDEPAP